MVIVFSFLSSGFGKISRAYKFCNFLIYPLIEPRVRGLPFLSSRAVLNCSKELYFFIFVNTEIFETEFSFTELTGTIDQDAWDNALEGNITITFYAEDRAGNVGTENVVVIKRIPSQPSIPGYNLFVLLGVLSVIIITIERKLRNLSDKIKN